MGIQVIMAHPNHLNRRNIFINEALHAEGVITFGALSRHDHMTPSGLGLKTHTEIAGAMPFVGI